MSKSDIRQLLSLRDRENLAGWIRNGGNPFRHLFSLTYDQDDTIRWRAVEAIGLVAALRGPDNLERFRDYLRRLFWLMNDESGGLGRMAPETIAEILINLPSLIDEFAPLLPTFLNEEPFEHGTHWAIYRLAGVRPDAFESGVDAVAASLESDDPFCHGMAWLILTRMGRSDKLNGQQSKTDATLTIYDDETGCLKEQPLEVLLTEASAEVRETGMH